MPYTERQRRLLSLYFSEVDRKEHADVYLVRNLPPEVAATLNGVYSRSSASMRDNFLTRLEKGLQEAGRTLDDLPLPEPPPDPLSGVMADRSGQFLKTYAIDHGHNSLREGAVLHFAVENVSQLVTRFCQRERRCSFEESSTRYISFSREGHWRDPDVLAAGGTVAAAYEKILQQTFARYEEFSERLIAHLTRERPASPGEKEGPWLRAIRAEAFDSARYLLTPALFTKWGVVIDARTLSDLISELMSHPLREFQIVGQRLKEQGERVARTLLTHAGAVENLRHQNLVLPHLALELGSAPRHHGERRSHVALLAYDRELDNRLVASLLYERSTRSLTDCVRAASGLGREGRARILAEAIAARGPRDPLPAGIEGAAPFEFEVLVDFGAYRDIGRHRKGFLQQQALTTGHGYLVPPLLEAAGLDAEYRATLDEAADLQVEVQRSFPLQAGYVTPFAFLQRARIVFDARQLAYFVELRSGPEGHFAYRKVALDMYREVQRVSPLFASLIRAHEGDAFLGRMTAEQTADERRGRRMRQAGDA
jgi:thymidylate synthase ThyX